MIKTILWDLDNTLLDFDIAEKNAIKSLFEKHNLGPCTDSMLKEYDKINKAYWKKFEKKEIDKKFGLVQRYVDFLNLYNLKFLSFERHPWLSALECHNMPTNKLAKNKPVVFTCL